MYIYLIGTQLDTKTSHKIGDHTLINITDGNQSNANVIKNKDDDIVHHSKSTVNRSEGDSLSEVTGRNC